MDMSYYIIFLFLFVASLCAAYLTGKGVARTTATTNFSLILLLYVFGLFARLDVGMCVFFALVGALLVASVVRLGIKKDFSRLVRDLTSPAGIFYFVAGIALGVLFTRLLSWHWDETSHWALVVKNMVAYDDFGNLGDTTTMYNRYVPACGLFLYAFQFFNAAALNGHFFAAFALLVLSMLLPVTELFRHKISVGCILTLLGNKM